MIKKVDLHNAVDLLFTITVVITIFAAALSNVFIDPEMIKKVLWITLAGTLISAACCLYFSITEKDRKYLLVSLTFSVSVVVNLIAMTKL